MHGTIRVVNQHSQEYQHQYFREDEQSILVDVTVWNREYESQLLRT
jgi:hypothetical protein